MSELILHGRLCRDPWLRIVPSATEAFVLASLPENPCLVPLSLWLAHRDVLCLRAINGTLGVVLQADDDPFALAEDVHHFIVIAVHFDRFVDGRGYSLARQLRRHLGFNGQLMACGDVLRDQFFYLTRCGFDALKPAEGRYTPQQLHAALASVTEFNSTYQRGFA